MDSGMGGDQNNFLMVIKLPAYDLLGELETEIGWKVKSVFQDVINRLQKDNELSQEDKAYLNTIIDDKNLDQVIKGQPSERFIS